MGNVSTGYIMSHDQWHHVFVYGTLQSRAQTIRSLTESSQTEFVAHCQTINNYQMYDLGHFPGVTIGNQSEGHPVTGELWRVTDVVRAELDVIEGYPDFYDREIIDTTAGRAWMYYLPQACRYDCREIAQHQGVVSWLDQSSPLELA